MYYQLMIRTEFPYMSQQGDFVEKGKMTLKYLYGKANIHTYKEEKQTWRTYITQFQDLF